MALPDDHPRGSDPRPPPVIDPVRPACGPRPPREAAPPVRQGWLSPIEPAPVRENFKANRPRALVRCGLFGILYGLSLFAEFHLRQ